MTNTQNIPGTNTPQDAATQRSDVAAGMLRYGIEHGGKRHYEFEVRIPTMGDNLDALEACPDASSARVEVAMFALCMQRLGDIPADEITLGLLLSGLYPSDIDVIAETISNAKKKHLRQSENSDSSAN